MLRIRSYYSLASIHKIEFYHKNRWRVKCTRRVVALSCYRPQPCFLELEVGKQHFTLGYFERKFPVYFENWELWTSQRPNFDPYIALKSAKNCNFEKSCCFPKRLKELFQKGPVEWRNNLKKTLIRPLIVKARLVILHYFAIFTARCAFGQ